MMSPRSLLTEMDVLDSFAPCIVFRLLFVFSVLHVDHVLLLYRKKWLCIIPHERSHRYKSGRSTSSLSVRFPYLIYYFV
jgi:hypothetical protein